MLFSAEQRMDHHWQFIRTVPFITLFTLWQDITKTRRQEEDKKDTWQSDDNDYCRICFYCSTAVSGRCIYIYISFVFSLIYPENHISSVYRFQVQLYLAVFSLDTSCGYITHNFMVAWSFHCRFWLFWLKNMVSSQKVLIILFVILVILVEVKVILLVIQVILVEL